jgi:hypothetical protein
MRARFAVSKHQDAWALCRPIIVGAGLVPEARAEPGVEFVGLGPSQLTFPYAPSLGLQREAGDQESYVSATKADRCE